MEIGDLYQIRLDDLLKGGGKMLGKIKMDTDTVKSNQIMMNLGWAALILSFVFSVWNNYGGDNSFLQFINAAVPWVMMGAGIACIMASNSNKKLRNL